MQKVAQMELPLWPADPDALYIDQAMVNSNMGERNFFAAYTQWGIKQIDSEFCRRIQNLAKDPEQIIEDIIISMKYHYFPERPLWNGTVTPEDRKREYFDGEREKYLNDSPESIRNDILSNEHLHACIKENLLFNLDNYAIIWKELQDADWASLLQAVDDYIVIAPEEG